MLQQVIQTSLKFLLGKETSEKKTSKNFETKVNSVSKFDHKFGKLNTYIKNNARLRTTGISASVTLATIMTLAAFPIIKNVQVAEAAPGTATAATTVLNMTSSASANLNLVVKSSDGTFAASSENDLAKFGVTTNNFTGYTLTITGPENNDLTNDNTEKVFTSIDSILDAQSFTNGSGDLYNGKYGYYPSKYNSTVNTYFRPAPTETATTLDVTNEANNESNNYTIGLGARADYSTPNGVYSNTFILTLVANPVEYTINYADNSGDDTVTPTLPAPTTGETSNTFIPITNDKPTRANYTFTGWCNKPTTINGEGETVCPEDGVTYNSGENYEIDQTTSNITTLYTIWTINKYSLTINFAGSGVNNVKVCTITGDCTGEDLISTITTSGNKIENLISGHTVYLYPSFNDNYEFSSWENSGSYGTLSCTASNTCSSDQNPSFTIGGGDGIVTITGKSTAFCTASDANCMQYSAEQESCGNTLMDARDGATYTTAAIGSLCWMTQNLRFVGTNLTTDLTNIDVNKTISYGDLTSGNSFDENRIHNSGNTTNGVWYNYAAASAGTITGDSNTTEAKYSLCPSGWRLPAKSELAKPVPFQDPFSVVTGGFYDKGDLIGESVGYWWSSTAEGTPRRHYMYYNGPSLDSGSNPRTAGYYVRCVRSTVVTSIAEKLNGGAIRMQDVDNTVTSIMIDQKQYKMIDSRDTQIYTVAKINGNVWMTRNLAIGCYGSGASYSGVVLSQRLTSDDSNVSSNYTTPTANTTSMSSYESANILCNATYGAWYNFVAASAGTITGNPNYDAAVYDICPKGWTLPTRGQVEGIGINDGTYIPAFSPVAGGYNLRGMKNAENGYWWSSTGGSNITRRTLTYDGAILSINSGINRFIGIYIRCVAK